MAFRTFKAAAFVSAACGLFLAAGAGAQTLRVAVPGNDMASLDPHRATATLDVNVVNWIFNGLVRIKPGQISPEMIEPDLAESWTSTPDKKEWTFKLRDNVQCQGDYGALTADDVVFSLKRASAKETSSFFADYLALQ
jgi:peptide/nickel transport system substrate-binding protein